MQARRNMPAVLVGDNAPGDEEPLPARNMADQIFTIATVGLGVLAVLSVAAVVLSFWWS